MLTFLSLVQLILYIPLLALAGQATEVSIRSDSDERQHEFELVGAIASVDTGARSFVLRGVTVSFANDPSVENGTLADLAPNRKVEVRGRLSSVGTGLGRPRRTAA